MLGADAAIQNLKARKALQHAEIDQAGSVIAATQADLDRTKLELTRQRDPAGDHLRHAQKVEQAVADEKRFEATLERNKAELEGQRRADGRARYRGIPAPGPGQGEAGAPRSGQDQSRLYQDLRAGGRHGRASAGCAPGNMCAPGPRSSPWSRSSNVWVIANYKETQLTHVAIGQKAEITFDTFPGITVTGRVDSIAPASGSQFSLLPPDNATGNFTKVVQRIPVKILLDPGSPLAGRLRPGMSAVATILTDSAPAKP